MNRTNRPAEIPLEGDFNCWSCGFDLPDLLLAVCKTGKTGLLRFVSAEAEKTLFLRDGEIIFAKSTSQDDRLGEYLLREGEISLQDLSKCIHLIKPGKRLGAILVEKGLLDPKQLVQAVIGQIRAIVLSLFRWTEAWYGFNEKELPSKETITLDMPTAQLILDGVKLIESWRRITQSLGDMSSVYRRVSGNEEVLRGLDVDKATLEVLASISRPKSVTETCVESELGDLEVCRMMWVFRCFGWIEQVDQAESRPERQAPDPKSEAIAARKASASAKKKSPPQVPEPKSAPSAEEISIEIIEGEPLESPKGRETAGASAPMVATPLAVGAANEVSRKVPELSPVDPPVSASFAQVDRSPVEKPKLVESEPEIDLGDPFEFTESDPVIDLGAPSSASGSDPEIDLGTPLHPAGSDLGRADPPETPRSSPKSVSARKKSSSEDPDKAVEPGRSGPALEEDGNKVLPDATKSSKVEPVVETVDMDLEGLGMVLGNGNKE